MKFGVFILLILLIVSNGFWVYKSLDEAVSCMYSDASYDISNQLVKQLFVVSNLNLIGLTVEDAKAKVGKDIHGFDPFEKEGCLYVGQVCLQVSANNTIDSIRQPFQ